MDKRNSEGQSQGEQTFGLRTGLPPVSGKDLAPPPTKEEARATNAGELAPRGITKKLLNAAKNHPVRTIGATLAIAAGGAYATYENVPAVHRAVGSAFLDHLKGKPLSYASVPAVHQAVDSAFEVSTNPEAFDNNATKGVVGPNNIFVVPTEVFNKAPSVDAEGKPIFDFPWDPNHPVAIPYSKIALGDKQIARMESDGLGLPNANDYRGYQPEMYSDNPLPAGFEFPTIYPGRLFFSGSEYDEEASRKSPSNPYGLAVYKGPINMAIIEFIAPNGVLYFIKISIQDDRGGALPIEPLIDAPFINPENGNGEKWKKGTPIKRGQKVFSIIEEGTLYMYIEGGRKGRLDGPNTERVPGDFKFKTGTAAGITKVLVGDTK